MKGLSLPSLPSLPFNFKSHSSSKIKPLTLSDVMVAFINQQSTTDSTLLLKSYLKHHKEEQMNNQQQVEHGQEIIMLPTFAIQQLTQVQLLSYHLDHKHLNLECVSNYEHLLLGVENKLSKSIEVHSERMKDGEIALQQLQQKLYEVYQLIKKSRSPITSLQTHAKGKYSKIKLLLQRKQNILSTLHTLSVWNKHNLSTILTFNPQSIDLPSTNLKQILTQMHQFINQGTEKSNQDNSNESINENSIGSNENNGSNGIKSINTVLSNVVELSLGRLVKVVEQRMGMVITHIKDNMLFSIINYKDDETYSRICAQYSEILSQQYLPSSHQSYLSAPSLFIAPNLTSIYSNCILLQHNANTINNTKESQRKQQQKQQINTYSHTYTLDSMSLQAYMEFFDKLFAAYCKYIENWHRVTTYHCGQGNGQLWIRGRAQLRQKILQKISNILKYSSKFDELSEHPTLLMQFFTNLYEFIGSIQQWLGNSVVNQQSTLNTQNTSTMISTMIGNKMTASTQLLVKTNNSLLKNLFIEYFDPDKYKQTALSTQSPQSILSRINEKYSLSNQNISKFNNILHGIAEDNAENQSKTILEITKSIPLPQIHLPLSLKLLEIGLQYLNRQRFYPCPQYVYVQQHFQFILFILYQTLLPSNLKSIKEERQNPNQSPQKKDIWNQIAEIRQEGEKRERFKNVWLWLESGVGSLFQGLTINMFVNVNKLYQEKTDKFEATIIKLNQKIISLLNQLYLVYAYLNHLQSNIPSKNNNPMKILPFLQLLSLLLSPYFALVSKKYSPHVLPSFTTLKWDIKKLTIQTVQIYKDYREKTLQIYKKYDLNHSTSTTSKQPQYTYLSVMISELQAQILWRFLMQLYSRIQKMNDNGRQLIRLDCIQISKHLSLSLPANSPYVFSYIELYLNLANQRTQIKLLENIGKIHNGYPPICWKSSLLWLYADMSSRQKKEWTNKIYQIYK